MYSRGSFFFRNNGRICLRCLPAIHAMARSQYSNTIWRRSCAQHPDALSNLAEMVAPRLAKNKRLHRIIAQNASPVWTQTKSGLRLRSMSVPFEPEKLEGLFRCIVRGLLFHHWGVRLTDQHSLDVMLIASGSLSFFDRLMQMSAKGRVSSNLGNGTFLYEGIQGTDNDAISVWRFSIYGGLKMAGDLDIAGEQAA